MGCRGQSGQRGQSCGDIGANWQLAGLCQGEWPAAVIALRRRTAAVDHDSAQKACRQAVNVNPVQCPTAARKAAGQHCPIRRETVALAPRAIGRNMEQPPIWPSDHRGWGVIAAGGLGQMDRIKRARHAQRPLAQGFTPTETTVAPVMKAALDLWRDPSDQRTGPTHPPPCGAGRAGRCLRLVLDRICPCLGLPPLTVTGRNAMSEADRPQRGQTVIASHRGQRPPGG